MSISTWKKLLKKSSKSLISRRFLFKNSLIYIQSSVLLYFVIFSVHYYEKYKKNDDLQLASAVFDSNSKTLTLLFYIESGNFNNDVFLIDSDKNETKLKLEDIGFLDNPHIKVWSSEINDENGIGLTSEHRKSEKLEAHTGRPALEIFPQEPYSDLHNIVSCFTPVVDDYEMVLNSLTSSISMGSFVHFPYLQLTGELYKLLKNIEKSGNLRLGAHPLLRFPSESPKILNDLSHLHCYLMYRNSAQFLIFQNSQSIVLPLFFPDYHSEFNTVFQMPRVDGYGILDYNAKVLVEGEKEFSDFSVQKSMRNARIKIGNGYSKSFVMKLKSTSLSSSFRIPMYTSKTSKSTKINDQLASKLDEVSEKLEESDVFWNVIRNCHLDDETWKCGSGKSCAWESGPVCFGVILDMVGAVFLITFIVLIVGVSFFGWFGIKPKTIRRKLRD